MAFASEYGFREQGSTNFEGTSPTEYSEPSLDGNGVENTVNQQNECQGNIVICQNILTRFICTERAVCVIGNLDPFLLVLPN
jgi:hypothetical protein